MTNYRITKKECENRINKNKVCSHCGNKLSAIETVDNAGNPTYWIGCKSCQRYDIGIERKYFEIARELVEKDILICYPHLKKEESDKEYWLKAQTGGLSSKIKLIDEMLSAQ